MKLIFLILLKLYSTASRLKCGNIDDTSVSVVPPHLRASESRILSNGFSFLTGAQVYLDLNNVSDVSLDSNMVFLIGNNQKVSGCGTVIQDAGSVFSKVTFNFLSGNVYNPHFAMLVEADGYQYTSHKCLVSDIPIRAESIHEPRVVMSDGSCPVFPSSPPPPPLLPRPPPAAGTVQLTLPSSSVLPSVPFGTFSLFTFPGFSPLLPVVSECRMCNDVSPGEDPFTSCAIPRFTKPSVHTARLFLVHQCGRFFR